MLAQPNQKSVKHQRPSIDRAAQDRVAQAIDLMREKENLAKLKRQQPSKEEVQLVCTAAAGASVHEPNGTLQVYRTDDLSGLPEALKVIAFGTSYDPRTDRRYRVYSDKSWPSYDVVVYSYVSANGNRSFTVGVSRHSRMNDLFGWMAFDHPISDSTDWKKQIAPECRNQHP